MAHRALLYRTLRAAAVAAFVLLLLVGVAIQLQQRLLRYRTEQLLADVHKIRLYESTWNEAQALMKRWGAWGNYEGNCSAEDCVYRIELEDGSRTLLRSISDRQARWFVRLGLPIYHLFGGRYAAIQVQFIVQDGRIWRTSTAVALEVPPLGILRDKEIDSANTGYFILVNTRSVQKPGLSSSGGYWILGTNEQLSLHPYYKAGRPSGCTNCLAAVVTYSPRTPHDEVVRLTSFDLSCISRVLPCKRIQQLLPAATPWHLYDNGTPDYLRIDSDEPLPCKTAVWARARDASVVLAVEALSDSTQNTPGAARMHAHVRVIDSLKDRSPWPLGTGLTAFTDAGSFGTRPFESPEPLKTGHRYIVFPIIGDSDRSGELYAPRCGVVDDTPEAREELKRGFAENDNLRRPELSFGGFPWN